MKRLEARLGFTGSLAGNTSYSVRFDSFTSPDAWFAPESFPESSFLGAPNGTEPFDVFLYEGYIRIHRFLIPGLKLTIGKQRTHWLLSDPLYYYMWPESTGMGGRIAPE